MLVAKGRLPFRMPGVFAAFVVGIVLYYGLGPLGWLGAGLSAAPRPVQLQLRAAVADAGLHRQACR